MTTALAHALNTSLRDAMHADEKVVLLGEDIGGLGGVFRVTDGLQKEFGDMRVVSTPLGEAGIIGSAIGLALAGYRPVCEIQFDGFVYPAMSEIVTQLAKYRHRSGGLVSLPVVLRLPYGGGIGAVEHHGESPEAHFVHTPGLRVLCPSNAQEAYDMLGEAIRSEDPVIFLEPKRAYWAKSELQADSESRGIDIDRARITRPGSDLTLVAWGALMPLAEKVAETFEAEGKSIEVIDMRSLSPIDDETVVESVRRTGRLVITHEASRTGGLAGELAARVQEQAFYELEAPILRVTGYDTPYPPSRLERDWLPNLDRLLEACDRSFSH